jgi:hypothetical protein
MRPKTKFHKHVYSLAKRVPKLSDKQKEWARMNIHTHYVYVNKDNFTCFECGHRWYKDRDSNDMFHAILGVTCPECGMELQISPGRVRTRYDDKMFYIYSTYGGCQVVRIFRLIRNIKCQKPAEYIYQELIQHWISPEGKYTVRAVLVTGGWNPSWTWSKMELRHKNEKYYQHAKHTYSKTSFIPELIRNGFDKDNILMHPAYFMEQLLSEPKIETLYKAGQFSLLTNAVGEKELEMYWPQMKMAMRRGIIIDDAKMWFDHFALLKKLCRDIMSPKYIFPDNLKKEHARLNKKLDALRRKRKRIQLQAEIEADEIFYRAQKEKYFDLKYNVGGIIIEPLRSVQEFVKEGEELEHCIFNSEYHRRKTSLIFSAKLNGERLETAEYSLETFKVVQCHGRDNKNSDYHEVIIEALNRASPDIYARTYPEESNNKLNLTPTEFAQYPLIV